MKRGPGHPSVPRGLRCAGLLAVVALLTWPYPSRPADAASAERPNVIVILTDDQGTLDMNAYGAQDLETPHMDALARRGVRFTQFYAGAPVCSPSRAALLTGRAPLRAGLPENASPPPIDRAAGGEQGLPGSEVTLAELLGGAGYATAHIGKWHLGTEPAMRPHAQGFDYTFGHLGGCIDNYAHFFYWNGPNRHDLWENGKTVHHPGRFFPDLMVEKAGQFMEENRDRPFFLYFAINLPHYPLQGEPKWLEKYADLPYPRRLYAAFVSTMDERIGRLAAKVDELGLREKTLIIFQSDHGHSVEERTHGGGGYAGSYRGAKFSLFEAGIRVPALVSLPGIVPEGAVRAQLAHGTDWLPTIADFAGVTLPERTLDGKSLRRVIVDDAPSPHETVHWQVGRGDEAQWAVRQGPWKLIGNPHDPTAPESIKTDRFLSNLERDETEQTNFAADHPAVARELEQLHDAWLAAMRGGESSRR